MTYELPCAGQGPDVRLCARCERVAACPRAPVSDVTRGVSCGLVALALVVGLIVALCFIP